jgi:hypothetical protein
MWVLSVRIPPTPCVCAPASHVCLSARLFVCAWVCVCLGMCVRFCNVGTFRSHPTHSLCVCPCQSRVPVCASVCVCLGMCVRFCMWVLSVRILPTPCVCVGEVTCAWHMCAWACVRASECVCACVRVCVLVAVNTPLRTHSRAPCRASRSHPTAPWGCVWLPWPLLWPSSRPSPPAWWPSPRGAPARGTASATRRTAGVPPAVS